ncbi:RNA polymerase sigma factor [Algicella marina]|uniref:RNA polymerase sigma factor n=1 Tax=Algicella marina TaxID=2683284 RepID=A0A6P1SZ62_9RHOB|nr:RNA polymerase sigma factor [Algicella marina]QHQ35037.1 RNA polymerase sigma factor [Algicella marina]
MSVPDVKSELVEHLPAMRAFARSLARDASAADDLVQDTIVKAWSNLDKFKPGTNLKAWLFTILRNTFYSNIRKKKWEVEDVDDEMAGQMSVKPEHDGRLAMEEFKHAFVRLPDDQREALILVGASGFSYEEAALMCDCAIGTIKSRVNRGRKRLTELLGLDDDEDLSLTDKGTLAALTEPSI